MAIEKGYKIQKIFEVWHYPKTSCDIFKGYVKTFVKIKDESSSHNFKTKQNKENYRKKVFDSLGIDLNEFHPNPGRRFIAKLCLNNLWGHFGMRINKPQVVYATSSAEFYDVLFDDEVENFSLVFIHDMCQMNFNLKNDFVKNIFTNNIGLAAFTTSHARLKLYEVLDILGERVLGFDTDSAWYVEKENENLLQSKLGNSLGELKDELDGNWIENWVGTGPKSYACEVWSKAPWQQNAGGIAKKENVCKVKGFALNLQILETINQFSMEDIVQRKIQEITIENNLISRSNYKKVIHKKQVKKFSIDYDKRRIEGEKTYPWGY